MYKRDREHRIGLALTVVPVVVLSVVLVLALIGMTGPLGVLRGSPVLTILIVVTVLIGAYYLKRSDTYPPPNYRRRGFDRFT